MDGPRLTEERLRHHLDANQVMRERMCLALLPLLGPYTREQPRRPKGGPDGGRDIEAIYQGTALFWGGVGFRNGGGADDSARREIEKKFKDDLHSALTENPSIAGFFFFTNVDLTPGRMEDLKAHGYGKGLAVVDIFDMERLRHILDSPEGLIARLQYLEIPMSVTEQGALVAKFGSQIQNAVTARFDRVERTLAQMERFLDFQKPLLRLDLYIELTRSATSVVIGNEAVRLRIHGLHDISKTFSCLIVNNFVHRNSDKNLVVSTHMWTDEDPSKPLSFRPSVSHSRDVITSYSELSLTTGGQRVRIADLTIVELEAYCTSGLYSMIKQISVDANGYEIFCCTPGEQKAAPGLKWPNNLPNDVGELEWASVMASQQRNLFFDPPKPSGRFLPLVKV
jgi:hypothetical protein